MSIREIFYYTFYTICFVLSILSGIKGGFTGTHTPPMPFAIEFLTLPIGFVLFFVDAIAWRSTKVHKIGLTANGLVMVYVLVLCFK